MLLAFFPFRQCAYVFVLMPSAICFYSMDPQSNRTVCDNCGKQLNCSDTVNFGHHQNSRACVTTVELKSRASRAPRQLVSRFYSRAGIAAVAGAAATEAAPSQTSHILLSTCVSMLGRTAHPFSLFSYPWVVTSTQYSLLKTFNRSADE